MANFDPRVLISMEIEQLLRMYSFSIFDNISQRYKLCTEEMQFSFFRETILKLSIFINYFDGIILDVFLTDLSWTLLHT